MEIVVWPCSWFNNCLLYPSYLQYKKKISWIIDYVVNLDDRKSRSGYLFFLTMVGWARKVARKLAFLGQCTKDGKKNHV